jgi:hypothetical protein
MKQKIEQVITPALLKQHNPYPQGNIFSEICPYIYMSLSPIDKTKYNAETLGGVVNQEGVHDLVKEAAQDAGVVFAIVCTNRDCAQLLDHVDHRYDREIGVMYLKVHSLDNDLNELLTDIRKNIMDRIIHEKEAKAKSLQKSLDKIRAHRDTVVDVTHLSWRP